LPLGDDVSGILYGAGQFVLGNRELALQESVSFRRLLELEGLTQHSFELRLLGEHPRAVANRVGQLTLRG
jgi:hypothetical protein